jgi:hypothetical protein
MTRPPRPKNPTRSPRKAVDALSGAVGPTPTRRPAKPALDFRIVPDTEYDGLYRLRLPSGELSGLVNLTRAKEALLEKSR